jgi:hypothetical protein
MQITGKEFNKFMDDDNYWGVYVLDEWSLTINGKGYSSDYDSMDLSSLDPDAKISMIYGYVVDEVTDKTVDFKKFFKEWREKETHTFFTVKVPKEHFSSVKKAIQESGGEIA